MITRVSFLVCLLCVALVNAKSNRIFGGEIAHEGQFKYQIALLDDEKMCAAAIIADKYVLTAAHCVVDNRGRFYLSEYYVIAGSTDIYADQNKYIAVETIYVPIKYRVKDHKNDIAVLKLRERLGLCSNMNLHEVNLPPSKDESYVGYTAVISGYGYNRAKVRTNPVTHEMEEFDGHTDGKLRYAITNIISNEECHEKNTKYKVDQNQLCVQSVQRGEKSTGMGQGDSGGPLVSGNTIIGVASLAPPAGREDLVPAIYTRVSSFTGFIIGVMKGANSNDMFVRHISSGESSSGSNRRKQSTSRLKDRILL